MKRRFLILVCLLLCLPLKAQNLEWAKSAGGTNYDYCYSVAIDDSGNSYTTGRFYGTVDFDPGPATYNLVGAPGSCLFIQKLGPNGNFIWAKAIYGNPTVGNDIKVDVHGNLYLTGNFGATVDFDPGAAVYNLTAVGTVDIFILKLNNAGNFVWAKRMGAASTTSGTAVSVDISGNVFSTGYFFGTADFDPGPGTYNLTAAGYFDIYVQKLDSSGNFVWATRMGGSGTNDDYGYDIQIDHQGNVITTGVFKGASDFDPGPANFIMSGGTNGDVFIQKLSNNGTFIWAKRFGAIYTDCANAIAIDSLNNIYSTGYFRGAVDFDPNAGIFQLSSNGVTSDDAFIQKLDSSGNFLWARSVGSATSDVGISIITDDYNNLYATGHFSGTTDFDPGLQSSNLTSAGSQDIYIQKFDAAANLIWVRKMGGAGDDQPHSIKVDESGNLYIGGSFYQTADFDPNTGTNNLTSNGQSDFFSLKLSQDSCSNFAIVIDSATSATCGSLSYVSAHAINGEQPVSYLWNTSPIDTDSIIQPSVGGIYSLTVTSANLCQRTTSLLVNAPTNYGYFDFSSNAIASTFRPNVGTDILLDTYNTSCDTSSGQLIFVLHPSVNFNYAIPSPDYISGDSLIWNFSHINFDSAHFIPRVNVTTPIGTPIGSLLSFHLKVLPMIGDADADNNTRNYRFPVLNGYDPNDKKVYPGGECNPGYILPNQKLTYTVRFQNTGNAEAINIYLMDSLDSDLDLSTLRIIGNSHPLITEVLPGNLIKFRFDNIWLPDSGSNPLGSNGYVIFEIMPNSGLVNGTIIKNDVDIYFDYNPAITTNFVQNTIIDTLPVLSSIQNVSICNGDSVQLGSTYYSTAGIFEEEFSSLVGCDSTVFFHLSVLNNSNSNLTHTTCNFYNLNSQTYTNSGVYIQVINNHIGCDSTITLNLTILDSSSATFNLQDCNSVEFNSQTYLTSGLYTQLLSNAEGCDSLINLNVLVLSTTSNTINVNACNSYSANGFTYFNSGTYTQTLINNSGCDSNLTINLVVLDSSSNNLISTNCSSYTLNSTTYYSSGIYTQTLTNVMGCDSIITLHLTIHDTTTNTITTSECDSYTLNSITYNSSGIYTQAFTNSVGCDSTLVIDLTINNIDNSILQTGFTLTANEPSATYQWIDCNNSNQPIAGATGQSYAATTNGNYAVIVSANGCTDTSACQTIFGFGIEDQNFSSGLSASPNPTSSLVNLHSKNDLINATLVITNINGKILLQKKELNGSSFQIDLSELNAGMYFFHLISEGKKGVIKVIKN